MNRKKNANGNQTMVKLGKIGITPAGEYDAGKTYDKLCLVLGADGNSYLSTQESVTGIEPGVTEGWENYWQFLCGSGKGGGVQSDYAQNDETQMDYIKNRPGGYYQTVPAVAAVDIQWDGVVGDRPNVDAGGMILVKVSDEILTAEQMIGAMATMVQGSGNQSALVTENDIRSGDGFVAAFRQIISSFSKTTIEGLSVPETGTYFAYMEQDGETTYISGLTKPETQNLVPIPGELTNIKGGYDIPAKTDELLNQTVTPEQWNDGNTQVTLKVAMVEGATVTGTAGGVEVHGTVSKSGKYLHVDLMSNENEELYALESDGYLEYIQDTAPTTDVAFALTQKIGTHPKVIPAEYLDTAALETSISNAQNTANEAKTAADNAQNTANEAKTAADNAQNTANEAKTAADNAQLFNAIGYTNNSDTKTVEIGTLQGYYNNQITKTLNSPNILIGSEITLTDGDGNSDKKIYTGDSLQFSLGNLRQIIVYMTVWSNDTYQFSTQQGKQINGVTMTYSEVPVKSAYSKYGVWLAPYVIAQHLYMKATGGKNAKIFKITVDDSGALSATEVTS